MYARFNIDGPRMNAVTKQIMVQINEADKLKDSLGGPFNLETDLELMPPVVQMSILFRSEPTLKPVLADMMLGFMLAPEDSIALILAIGYKMAQEDARLSTEIAELEKMFAVIPSESQEGK